MTIRSVKKKHKYFETIGNDNASIGWMRDEIFSKRMFSNKMASYRIC